MAKNLIGSKWVDASDGNIINVYNPATEEFIDSVPESTVEDCDNAVIEARKGYKKWSKIPLHERADILYKFNDLVLKNKDELAKLLCMETGKPIKEAVGEIANVNIGLRAFIEKAKHEYGALIPCGQEKGNEKNIQYTMQYPHGVVVAIIPFNFPSDLFTQKVPSALIMGNSVILKPSSHNPLTLCKYAEILIEAGVVEGAINVINGTGALAAQALAKNPGVDLVSLTGSTYAGIETMKTCSSNLTHVTLELGGNDAFILHNDGDIDLAVNETIWGRFYNTGQVCCASKRFLIHSDLKEEYTRKLVERIKQIKLGDPMDMNTELGCLINENAAINIEKQVTDMVELGARIVYGGKRNKAFYEPTIIDNVTKDMPVAKDLEIFGPVVSIIEYTNIEEAIKIANSSSFGLCGNIISRDIKTCMKVSNELECGAVIINGASFFRSFEMPFGGWKHSGIGNEGVMSTLKEMSRTKTTIFKNIL